jgi:hypothetical protein
MESRAGIPSILNVAVNGGARLASCSGSCIVLCQGEECLSFPAGRLFTVLTELPHYSFLVEKNR